MVAPDPRALLGHPVAQPVIQAPLARLVSLEQQEEPDRPERQVQVAPDPPAALAQPEVPVPGQPARLAQRAQQDQLVQRGPQVSPVQLALRRIPDQRDRLEQRVHSERAPPAQPAAPVRPVAQDH